MKCRKLKALALLILGAALVVPIRAQMRKPSEPASARWLS